MANSKINIVDTTLRDGSHAVSHSFTAEQAAAVAAGLDKAGIELIEISHGDGIAGSSINYGFSKVSELDLIEAAGKVVKKAKLGVLLLPGIGTIEDLKEARERGANAVRVATHVTEADIAVQHIAWAKQAGMFTVGFLMMTHMASPETIVEQAKIFVDAGADYINLADSSGYMVPKDVRARIGALKAAISIPVGFHSHNNLGLAVANSLAAVEEGASYIDVTCRGLGAGAGNTQGEVFCAVMERLGYETGVHCYELMDLAENVVEPIMLRPQVIRTDSLMLGYAGVYSSFLLHTRKAAEKYGIAPRDILVELGKRRMVGGQEDMIVDVAYQLSQKK
ncbi:4-hydroxy-2-oxovalerate aldolase [Treponema primitia ZAS-2]|uniref:4-hydroxy-2-oxovalerate aldolase n=1 Tax=Treponema primitia (strain ATCC BAA-887 / DSM 12427 / ZAS-2) TaxID=545694 RepID=F5YQW2_TREPZ|nr:4-hydroxy-2-oxovalerate aldolase [Treponema primitia]AEF85149.1 4-hydroxy-2-oxovalerate aldolase [Treponema primitia ZAS-2]